MQPIPLLARTAPARTRPLRALTLGLVLIIATALALAGCGGGGGDGDRRSPFINFTGGPDGDIILDANGDVFRVTEREGCLWSDQYQFVTNWCLVGSGSRLDLGGYYAVLLDHPDNLGGCVTVLAEERSLLLIDIYIARDGVMDYAITNLPAVRC